MESKYYTNRTKAHAAPAAAPTEEALPSVTCPYCGWRLMDRKTRTTGIIATKCRNFRRIVSADLSFRRTDPAAAAVLFGL